LGLEVKFRRTLNYREDLFDLFEELRDCNCAHVFLRSTLWDCRGRVHAYLRPWVDFEYKLVVELRRRPGTS
jgi:hypothetical protein